MTKNSILTPSGARLQLVKHSKEENPHWIFLPGGPGLGSESLTQLLNLLKLPGTMWRLDLPGDGSNTTSNNYEAFSHWSSALIEAVGQFKHVILVAHSTGGMYVLSTPELEDLLEGLVLLDSAPDAGWQSSFEKVLKNIPIPELETLQEKYRKNPGNQTLKELTVASAPYLFTKEGLAAGIILLSSLSYSDGAYRWSEEHFDPTYRAKWIPQSIPTMILGGERDLITPLRLFAEAPQFHCNHIEIKSIKNAGHFPWIDNPADVAEAFKDYCARKDFPSAT